jgi:predicted metal-dependent hydrolase
MEDQSPQLIEPENCNGSLHPQAIIGLELFNSREYFEAHEALEAAWREETGSIRGLYKGILQVAVAYLHIQRGNYVGARKMFHRCRLWLDPFPDICRGINVSQFKRDYQAVESLLVRLGPDALHDLDLDQLKPVVYTPIQS